MISKSDLKNAHDMQTTLKDNQGLPRVFSSCVHPRSSSCTSSGATSVRCHASVQFGLAGVVSSTTGVLVVFFAAPESLPRKTRVKKGIVRREREREREKGGGEIEWDIFFLLLGGDIISPSEGQLVIRNVRDRGEDGFDCEPCE